MKRDTRRKFLTGALSGGLLSTAGCQAPEFLRELTGTRVSCNSQTHPELRVTPIVSEITHDDGSWTVTVRTEMEVEYADSDVGLFDVSLTAFDEDQAVVGERSLPNMPWADVPSENRSSFEGTCEGTHTSGALSRTATVTADRFPAWVGLRAHYVTVLRTVQVSQYTGDIPAADPDPSEYELRDVADDLEDHIYREPGESLTESPTDRRTAVNETTPAE